MASRNLGTLTIDLVAKTAGFTQGMTKAERDSAKWRKQVERDVKAVGAGINKALIAGAAAATAGVAATVALTKQGLEAVQSQANLAKSLDTTYDSITALQLAAGDVGLDGLEGSLTRLNRRLGAAEVGAGAAASAVKALNLDLQALSNMDVDERVATIADAIRDSGVSMQRAARFAQDLGFEQQQAAEFFTQGGDAIRAYRGQVDALGLSLRDIDAQKVIDAQNAMGIFGDITRSVSQTLAVQFAPLITQVASDIEAAAIETGGFNDEIVQLTDNAVRAGAFVASAVDATGRVFGVLGRTATLVFLNAELKSYELADSFYNGPINAINDLIAQMNRLPGIDIEPRALSSFGAEIQQQIKILTGAIAEGEQDVQDILLKPLAGEGIIEYYENAKDAAEDAAAAAVKLRNEAEKDAPDLIDPEEIKRREQEAARAAAAQKSRLEGIAKEISALERAAEVWGMSADEVKIYDLAAQGATESDILRAEAALKVVGALEAQSKAIEDQQAINASAAGIIEGLRSQEEAIRESYENRRNLILESTIHTEEEKNAAIMALQEEHNEQMLEINGSYWERWLEGAEENLTNFDEIAGQVVENFTGRFGDAFESMIFDAETFGEAAQGMLQSLARATVNAVGEMIAQELALLAIKKMRPAAASAAASAEIAAITATTAASTAATATSTATQTAAAATTAVAWTPAAIAASIGSFGAAAAVGLAAVVAAMAFSGGFRKGGYTGNGGVDDVAGVVHGQEYVFDAASTARIGVGNLEAIRSGREPLASASAQMNSSIDRVSSSQARGGLNLVVNNMAPGVDVSARESVNSNGDPEYILDVVSRDMVNGGRTSDAVASITGTQYQGT